MSEFTDENDIGENNDLLQSHISKSTSRRKKNQVVKESCTYIPFIPIFASRPEIMSQTSSICANSSEIWPYMCSRIQHLTHSS